MSRRRRAGRQKAKICPMKMLGMVVLRTVSQGEEEGGEPATDTREREDKKQNMFRWKSGREKAMNIQKKET